METMSQGQGLSLRVKEGPFQHGADGQQRQGELHPHSLREKSKSGDEHLAGDTPTGVGRASASSKPCLWAIYHRLRQRMHFFPLRSGKGWWQDSPKGDLGSRSEGQDLLLPHMGVGGRGCHQATGCWNLNIKKEVMTRNCNRWVPKDRTGVLFPGGMRFHELPESAGKWHTRNTRLRQATDLGQVTHFLDHSTVTIHEKTLHKCGLMARNSLQAGQKAEQEAKPSSRRRKEV